jgi:hypothetical protein
VEGLNALYTRLLKFGLISVREAIRSQDQEWAEAEAELLHNVPSLIDETNVERHRYFWFTEREHYIEWAKSAGREGVGSRMRTYYEPIWREMEPIVLRLLSRSSPNEMPKA